MDDQHKIAGIPVQGFMPSCRTKNDHIVHM